MRNVLMLPTLLLLTVSAALAGGAGPHPTSYNCTDGSVIRPVYTRDTVRLSVQKGGSVQQYELQALRPHLYADAEHTWRPEGKKASFMIGAAGNKVVTCHTR